MFRLWRILGARASRSLGVRVFTNQELATYGLHDREQRCTAEMLPSSFVISKVIPEEVPVDTLNAKETCDFVLF